MNGDISFAEFKRTAKLSLPEICREIFHDNRQSIKVLKEEVAVRNLVKIVEATLRLCNTMGFATMSLRDLSRESGLSMGAMYSYFRSKDDLLRLLQGQGRAVVQRILENSLAGCENPLMKLRRAIQAHLYCSEILQPWFYLSYMETRGFPKDEFYRALEAELYTEKILVDIMSEGQSVGCFRQVNADFVGAAIKSILQDWYLKRWKYSRRKVSVEDYCGFIIDFVESYLLSGEKTLGASNGCE